MLNAGTDPAEAAHADAAVSVTCSNTGGRIGRFRLGHSILCPSQLSFVGYYYAVSYLNDSRVAVRFRAAKINAFKNFPAECSYLNSCCTWYEL